MERGIVNVYQDSATSDIKIQLSRVCEKNHLKGWPMLSFQIPI